MPHNERNENVPKLSADDHYHFVTGRLAEPAIREIVESLAKKHRFSFSFGVMPITVAALMTPKWLLRHLRVPPRATHVIVPGYLAEGMEEIRRAVGVPVLCGPRDCRELPEWFGQPAEPPRLDRYEVEIIAEINHAPRREIADVLAEARTLREQGADRIDLGCDPADRCAAIGDYVAALVDEGIPVSIDTFDPWEVNRAVSRGASLVLSVNGANREAAADWGAEVVVIPDTPRDEGSLRETAEFLLGREVPLRLDPILEPIGTGLMPSLLRYAATRREFPDVAMMMGIGNLTELSDVDSAGINLLLMGICAELRVHSVLTTQVINWARSSVRECDVARRLAYHAVTQGIPPKKVSDQLVMLRDPKLRTFPQGMFSGLADSLKDNNYRLFAQDEAIHLVTGGLYLSEGDPFRLFDELLTREVSRNVDAGHAFYLGFEMAKASIALQLGKQYEQDQPLRWGLLTRAESHHRIRRTSRHRRSPNPQESRMTDDRTFTPADTLKTPGPLSRAASREVDRIAIEEYGMHGLVLMENAGRGAAETIHRLAPDGPVVILCGQGNNAGDGYVIARHLQLLARDVRIVSVVDPSRLTGDAAANATIARRASIPLRTAEEPAALPAAIGNCGVLVDCLLGTGARGEPREPYRSAVLAANAATAAVRVAIDVPTGLDCDSGTAADVTFRADHTITFVSPKTGFRQESAAAVLGTVHVTGIGIPRGLLDSIAGWDEEG